MVDVEMLLRQELIVSKVLLRSRNYSLLVHLQLEVLDQLRGSETDPDKNRKFWLSHAMLASFPLPYSKHIRSITIANSPDLRIASIFFHTFATAARSTAVKIKIIGSSVPSNPQLPRIEPTG
jgi:hypothetical protein